MELFNNPDYDIDGRLSNMSVEDLIFAACRGGWPASLFSRTPAAQLMIARNLLNSICSEDISRIDDIQRNEKVDRKILQSYARNISNWSGQYLSRKVIGTPIAPS